MQNYSNILEPCAGIFKQSMGARNQVWIGLSYPLARIYRLAELIPWNRFHGSLKVLNSGSSAFRERIVSEISQNTSFLLLTLDLRASFMLIMH